ncbi:MAG: isoprenyl transferase [Firmicutes bacterium]|nr:isoprenyl transferase [Bacillota bacterium]
MLKDFIIPKHVGIIMDGNGRWAKKRGLLRINGHKEGMLVLKKTVESCKNLGVDYLTVYAFSTENWKRPKLEVSFLLNLLKYYINSELNYLKENNVSLKFIGSRIGLDKKIISMMEMIETETGNGKDMVFSIAFNYGGRMEITDGVKNIAQLVKNGSLLPEDIDEELISNNLYTKNMPDPDLIIRTSGEFRISNFLIWQGAYSEYYITDTLWPDFNEEELIKAFKVYNTRNRRFGGV